MYKSQEAKKAYYKERYQNNKDSYAKNNSNHWVKYAMKKLGKVDVTDDEVRECKNEYYREYRRTHKSSVDQNMENFWKRKAEQNEVQE